MIAVPSMGEAYPEPMATPHHPALAGYVVELKIQICKSRLAPLILPKRACRNSFTFVIYQYSNKCRDLSKKISKV
jgi:hypothetical protein